MAGGVNLGHFFAISLALLHSFCRLRAMPRGFRSAWFCLSLQRWRSEFLFFLGGVICQTVVSHGSVDAGAKAKRLRPGKFLLSQMFPLDEGGGGGGGGFLVFPLIAGFPMPGQTQDSGVHHAC